VERVRTLLARWLRTMQAQDDLLEALRAALQAQQQQNAVLSLLQPPHPILPALQPPMAPVSGLEVACALLQTQLFKATLASSPLQHPPVPIQPQALASNNALAPALQILQQAPLAPAASPAQSTLHLRDLLCELGRKPDNFIDVLTLPGIDRVGSRMSNNYSFPFRLHALLSNLPPELEPIIGFCAHGRALIVLNPYKVVDKVLKRYFHQSKLPSFHRQLGLWGFRRISSNNVDDGAYYHPLFLRGNKHLCSYMTRSGLKRSQQPKSIVPPPTTTPNFATMHKA